jgi:hypothetical protein
VGALAPADPGEGAPAAPATRRRPLLAAPVYR